MTPATTPTGLVPQPPRVAEGRRRTLIRRIGPALAVFLVLVAGFVWALTHARYVRPPKPAALPQQSFSYPRQAVSTLPRSGPPVRPPNSPSANHLYIPSLHTDASIVSVTPTQSRTDGQLSYGLPVPALPLVGVSSGGGALSGGPGTVLIAGHINFNGVQGPFWNLSQIAAGADIWTADSHGRLTRWRVFANPVYRKGGASWPDNVFTSTGPRTLVLVSCTGTLHYVPGYGYSYDDNQFVYATPVS